MLETSWQSELDKTALKYHKITLWVAVLFNLLFFITDYINIYEHWQSFLSFRIIVSLVCLITVLFHKQLKISIELMGVIPVLLIAIQNAYMWSVMDAAHLQKHTLAYIALFIGSGMFVFYHVYYSIFIVIATLIANLFFFYFNSQLSLDEVLVNGGFLTFAVAIFSILLIKMRYQLTKKELIARYALETSKHEIEEKNKEITASITYAKRIQEAILPPLLFWQKQLPNSFVLFSPKDIVSGDFYWMETVSSLEGGLKVGDNLHSNSPQGKMEKTIFFAACDCTGHGVPGAMVSVVCSNALTKTVIEEKIKEPGKILDRARNLVLERFQKSKEDVKDGMDIALCSLKLPSREACPEFISGGLGGVLQYAGANNPLWIIRSNTVIANLDKGKVKQSAKKDEITSSDSLRSHHRNDEYTLIEIKANKQPIGKVENPQPFTTHTIELLKGDTIYIFSDGFADQFGGPKGKKFKYKPFKELLLAIQEKSMEEQREIINKSFEDWKGNLEQIDDVCIIGVKV